MRPSEQLLNITFYLNRRMRILFVLSLMLCYNAAQFADPSEYNVFLPRSIYSTPLSIFKLLSGHPTSSRGESRNSGYFSCLIFLDNFRYSPSLFKNSQVIFVCLNILSFGHCTFKLAGKMVGFRKFV